MTLHRRGPCCCTSSRRRSSSSGCQARLVTPSVRDARLCWPLATSSEPPASASSAPSTEALELTAPSALSSSSRGTRPLTMGRGPDFDDVSFMAALRRARGSASGKL